MGNIYKNEKQHLYQLLKAGEMDQALSYYIKILLELNTKENIIHFYDFFYIFVNFGCESHIEEMVKKKQLHYHWQLNTLSYLFKGHQESNIASILKKATRGRRYYLAQYEFILGNYEKAEQLFLTIKPRSAKITLMLSVIAYHYQQFEKVDQYMKEYIDLSTEAEAGDLPKLYITTKDFNRKEMILTEIKNSLQYVIPLNIVKMSDFYLETEASHIDYDIEQLFQKNTSFMEKKAFVQAVELFSEVAKRQPTWYIPWQLLGNAYQGLRLNEDAYECYKISVKNSSFVKKEKGWYHLARFCESNGYLVEALAAYNEIIKINMINYNATGKVNQLISVLLINQDKRILFVDQKLEVHTLIEDVKTTILHKDYQKNYKTHLCLRNIFEFQNNLKEAYIQYKIAHQLAPTKITLKELSLWALYHKQFKEAKEHFQELVLYQTEKEFAKICIQIIEEMENDQLIDPKIVEVLGNLTKRKQPNLPDLKAFELECILNQDHKRGLNVFRVLTKLLTRDIGVNIIYGNFLEKNGYLEEAYEKYLEVYHYRPSLKIIYNICLFAMKNGWYDRANEIRIQNFSKFKNYESFDQSAERLLSLGNKINDHERDLYQNFCQSLREDSITDFIDFFTKALNSSFFDYDEVFLELKKRQSFGNRSNIVRVIFVRLLELFIQGNWKPSERNMDILHYTLQPYSNLLLNIQKYGAQGGMSVEGQMNFFKPIMDLDIPKYKHHFQSLKNGELDQYSLMFIACVIAIHDDKWAIAEISSAFQNNDISLEQYENYLQKLYQYIPVKEIYFNAAFLFFTNSKWEIACKYYEKSNEVSESSKQNTYFIALCKILSSIDSRDLKLDHFSLDELQFSINYLLNNEMTDYLTELEQFIGSYPKLYSDLYQGMCLKYKGQYNDAYKQFAELKEDNRIFYIKLIETLIYEFEKGMALEMDESFYNLLKNEMSNLIVKPQKV
jgi:hypothetical protein